MKKFSKFDCVKYISNLILIGIDDRSVHKVLLKKWLIYKNEISKVTQGNVDHVDLLFKDELCQKNIKNSSVIDGGFFIAFHYAYYPLIIYNIINDMKYSVVNFIIHEHNSDVDKLRNLCHGFNLNIKFIKVDDKGKFVREIIRANKNKEAILMLVDLPVSNARNELKRFELFGGGEFLYMDGFIRISSIIKKSPILLYHSIDEVSGKISLNEKVIFEPLAAFKVLEKIVYDAPYLWERLNDLDLFFYKANFENLSFITFKDSNEDSYYAYCSSTRKPYSINKLTYQNIKMMNGDLNIEFIRLISERFGVKHVL